MTAKTHILRGLAATTAIALAGPAAADTRILVNCFFPPQHPVCQEILAPWGQQVMEATEGRVQVAVLPQTMAPPPEQLLSVRAGVFDAAVQMSAFIANEVTGTQIAMLPFTGTLDSRVNSVALWRTYEAHLSAVDEYDGVELLGLFTIPGADFYSLNDTPIQSLADIGARKMWGVPGATAEILQGTGSAVVSGPAVQMTELIQNGVVDGFVGIPVSDTIAFNVLPAAQSVTRTEHKIFAASFSFVISDAKWAEISPEDQEAIRALSGEAFAELAGGVWNAAEEASIAQLEQSVEVLIATPEFEAELAAAGQPFVDRWVADATAKGIDGAAALDFYAAEIARLAAE